MLGKRELMKKRGAKCIVAGAMVAMISVAGISAYFTSTDSATNTWTVGNVKVDLVEDEYDKVPEERVNITPNKELTKDPLVKNIGLNDAFMFLKVTVPKASVSVANDNGLITSSDVQELFDYSIDSKWTLVDMSEDDTFNTYVYAYGTSTACTAVKPSQSTSVLFKNSKITFKNIVESSGFDGVTLEMPVEAYGIQTADLTSDDKTDPATVWNIIMGQTRVS